MKRREYLVGSAALIGSAGCLGNKEDDGSSGESNGEDLEPNGEQNGQTEENGTENVFTEAESEQINDFINDSDEDFRDYKEDLEDLEEEREDSEFLPPAEDFSWGNRQVFSPTESTVFYNFSGDESIQLETQNRIYKSASGIEPFGSGDRSVDSNLRNALTDLSLFDNRESANDFIKYDLDNDNAFQNLRNFISNIRNTQPYFQHFGDDEELTVPEDFDEEVVEELDDVLEEIDDIEDDYRELVDEVAGLNEKIDEKTEDFIGQLNTTLDEDADSYDKILEEDADQYRRTLNNFEQGVDVLYADVLGGAAEVILTKRLYEDAQDQANDILDKLEKDHDDYDDHDDEDDRHDTPDNGSDPEPEPEAEYTVEKRRVFDENEVYDAVKDRNDGDMDGYDRDDLLEEFRDRLEDRTGWSVSNSELFNGELDPTEIETIDLKWEQTRYGDIKNVGVRYTFEFEKKEGQFTTNRIPSNSYIELDDDFGEELIEYVQNERIR